jgi:protein SCO1/2
VAVRDRALRAYGSPDSQGWHVLTGDHEQIDRLADAAGFRYAYDAAHDEIAHPAGVVVLAPGGTIERYLYGIDFPATDLRLALVDAGQGRVGTIVDQVMLVCSHYEPTTGRYTPAIERGLQVFGLLSILILGAVLRRLGRVGPAAPPAPEG